jgi:hypothetical protein
LGGIPIFRIWRVFDCAVRGKRGNQEEDDKRTIQSPNLRRILSSTAYIAKSKGLKLRMILINLKNPPFGWAFQDS